jgi:hypothetical protein
LATKIDEFGGWKGLVLYSLVSSLISGAVIAGVLKWAFDKELEAWKTTRSWQSSALSEVVAPAVMHFGRTESLADRYRNDPRYGEAILLRESNATLRALLLTKSHLLPSELVQPAQCLLTHYDIWLKRFDLTLVDYKIKHAGAEPTPEERFDVGFASLEATKCGGFPKEAPRAFQQQFDVLRKHLYDLQPTAANPSFQPTAYGRG